MADQITVVPGPEAVAGRVILWERDPAHPDGEVYLAAPEEGDTAAPQRVGSTAAVAAAMREGRLVAASKAEPKPEK